MALTVTPMIHVPDVEATADWYRAIGFTVFDVARDGQDAVWAMVGHGEGRVMFNCGGAPSDAARREVDLYVDVPDVDALFEQVSDLAVVVKRPHDTFYGRREFIIRDLNGFWITFGELAG
ncbi:MAG TPA: VOC family protein [Caulobacter sp.]|nr:VOC family protein [Caulobacter sp.]